MVQTMDAETSPTDSKPETPTTIEEGASPTETKTKPLKDTINEFPDGGLVAWGTVVGAFFAQFVSTGWIYSIGVFQEYYKTHQLRNHSEGTIAWVLSLEVFMLFAMAPIVSFVGPRHGVRYMVMTGGFLHVFGLMMTSLSTEYYQFILAQGLCSPIGSSMLYHSGVHVVMEWFQKKRITALSIIFLGASLGGIIIPIMVQHISARIGFPWSIRIVAFMFLAMIMIIVPTLNKRIKPSKKPQALSLSNLKDTKLWLAILGICIAYLCTFVPYNFVVAHATKLGMSSNLASYLLPIMNAASVPGRMITAVVANRIGPFTAFAIISWATGILILTSWYLANSNVDIIVFSALYGLFTSGFQALALAVMAKVTPDYRYMPLRLGLGFMLLSLTTLISNPVAGYIVDDQHGKFKGLQIFTGSAVILGGVFFMLMRFLYVGTDWRAKA